MADKLVDEKLEERAFDETIKQLFGALALVLALPTGGGSLAVGTAVAGGASGYQALQSISKYQLEMALTSTDLEQAGVRHPPRSRRRWPLRWMRWSSSPTLAQALKVVRALRGPDGTRHRPRRGLPGTQQTAEIAAGFFRFLFELFSPSSGWRCGVIGSGQPQRDESAHAMPAHDDVHLRLVEHVSMWRRPVTLGGGSSSVNTGRAFSPEGWPSGGVGTEKSFSLIQ